MAITRRWTGDRAVDSFQGDVIRELARIPRGAIADGVLVEDVEFTAATEEEIDHRLGRGHSGYIVVRQNAAATFHESGEKDGRLLLTASATVTASVWVF